MSISVNKQPVVLMSVYMPHSGYADHHVEKIYKTIIETIGQEKCAKIIGGDFNAELGLGEGVEFSAVGHYTLNKANCRGEWMTQWLLENRLVALNTMYKKVPQKQVTYRSPKNDEKQLDYILLDKKHQSWSNHAESTDILHMGSDHRCVMAKFEIPKEKAKGKPRQSKAPMEEQQNETYEDGKQQEYLDIEQEVTETELKNNTKGAAGEATDMNAEAAKKEKEANEAEGRKTTDASAAQAAAAGNEGKRKGEAETTEGTATYEERTAATDASAAHAVAAIDENIEQRQAAAPEGTAATEDQEMNEKDERIWAFIQKEIYWKHEKDQIREISKNLKEYQRKQKDEETGKIQKVLEKVKDKNVQILYVIWKSLVRKNLDMFSELAVTKENTDHVKEDLNDIYYVTGENIDAVSSSQT